MWASIRLINLSRGDVDSSPPKYSQFSYTNSHTYLLNGCPRGSSRALTIASAFLQPTVAKEANSSARAEFISIKTLPPPISQNPRHEAEQRVWTRVVNSRELSEQIRNLEAVYVESAKRGIQVFQIMTLTPRVYSVGYDEHGHLCALARG